MNQRERLLAMAVGTVLLVVAGLYLYGKIDAQFDRRSGTIRQLRIENDRQKKTESEARDTERRLTAYKQMSLPSDAQLARSQYQAWLAEIVATAEWAEPQVKVISQPRLAMGATQLTCSVSGKCNLDQLSRLLYEFYRVNTIHRISRLPVKPIPDTKLLNVTMWVEALILPDAGTDKDFDSTVVSAFADAPFSQFATPILDRNLFGPANRPPEIAPLSTQEVELGKTFSLRITAKDPDRLDQLEYTLGPGAPEAAELDPRSGQLRWEPSEIGEFEFGLVVSDDGIPRLQGESAIRVHVVEPSAASIADAGKSELRFDDARFTYAIASLDVNGRRQVWFQIRTKGEILRLSEGDAVQVGSVDGKVTRIGDRDVEVTMDDKPLVVRIGDPLVGANIVGEGGL